ncbi:MAG: replication protein RepA [Chromatiales bacterium]|nr:replication protein RepA [Chromatiales bacterium]
MGAGERGEQRLARRERRREFAEGIREFRQRVGDEEPFRPSPQGLHHWTQDDQVDELVEAGLGEPGLGFMTALLATCCLPRTDLGETHQYVRRNGPFCLHLSRSGDEALPFGILPRLLLAWICTEVVRTGSPRLYLGPSLASFMRELGVQSSDSAGRFGVRTRLRDQMHRLFGANLRVEYESKVELRSRSVKGPLVEETDLWWEPRQFKKVAAWRSTVQLGRRFYEEILAHSVPIDLNVLRGMKRSSLGVDVFLWLTYRLHGLDRPLALSWRQLYRQFAPEPGRADVRVDAFRTRFLRELKKLQVAWPGLRFKLKHGSLQLLPSVGRIAPRESTDRL